MLEGRGRFGAGATRRLRLLRHDLPRDVRVGGEWADEATATIEVEQLEEGERQRIAALLVRTYFASLRPDEGIFVDLRLSAFTRGVVSGRLCWNPRPAWFAVRPGLRASLLSIYARHFDHRIAGAPLAAATASLLQEPGSAHPARTADEASAAFGAHLDGAGRADGAGGDGAAGPREAFAALGRAARESRTHLRPDLTVIAISLATLHRSLAHLSAPFDAPTLFRETHP